MASYTLQALADRVEGQLVRGDDRSITGVAAIGTAGPQDLAFFVAGDQGTVAKEHRTDWLLQSQAGVVLLSKDYANACSGPAIVVDQPRLAFAHLAVLWEVSVFKPGQHPTAIIGQDCDIDPSVRLGAHCVIGDRVKIAKGCSLGSGSIIESDVVMGMDCQIHPRAVVRHGTQIGHRCIIRSGAVVGEDGFGYEADGRRHWHRVPQLGCVILGDDVDIGAMSAIDRGALGNTILHQGVKCDNLVQIGHNVEVGAHSLICGCVGIAGSARIGQHCILGGGSRVNGHLTLADHTVIAGASSVDRSIDTPGVYAAFLTAQPHVRWKRILLSLQRLPDMIQQLRLLKKQVDALKQQQTR